MVGYDLDEVRAAFAAALIADEAAAAGLGSSSGSLVEDCFSDRLEAAGAEALERMYDRFGRVPAAAEVLGGALHEAGRAVAEAVSTPMIYALIAAVTELARLQGISKSEAVTILVEGQ